MRQSRAPLARCASSTVGDVRRLELGYVIAEHDAIETSIKILHDVTDTRPRDILEKRVVVRMIQRILQESGYLRGEGYCHDLLSFFEEVLGRRDHLEYTLFPSAPLCQALTASPWSADQNP